MGVASRAIGSRVLTANPVQGRRVEKPDIDFIALILG